MTVAFSHQVLTHLFAVDVEFILIFLESIVLELIFLLELGVNFSGCGGV
jgi:hypothetical protein